MATVVWLRACAVIDNVSISRRVVVAVVVIVCVGAEAQIVTAASLLVRHSKEPKRGMLQMPWAAVEDTQKAASAVKKSGASISLYKDSRQVRSLTPSKRSKRVTVEAKRPTSITEAREEFSRAYVLHRGCLDSGQTQ